MKSISTFLTTMALLTILPSCLSAKTTFDGNISYQGTSIPQFTLDEIVITGYSNAPELRLDFTSDKAVINSDNQQIANSELNEKGRKTQPNIIVSDQVITSSNENREQSYQKKPFMFYVLNRTTELGEKLVTTIYDGLFFRY